MPAYAILGAQWGDEGKGKIIDYLSAHFSKLTEEEWPDLSHFKRSTPGRIRTHNLSVRSRTLYPVELRVQNNRLQERLN